MKKPPPVFEVEYFEQAYGGDYDKRNPRYKFRSYVKEVGRFAPSRAQVLDVGCAYGLFIQEAAAAGFRVSGCDISKHAVEVARGRTPGANVFEADAAGLPPDRLYNVVTCFDIIEHVEDLDAAFSALWKVIKPSGILVMTVPVYDTLVGKAVAKLDKDPTHIHKHSRYWWLSQLKKRGFEVLSWKGIWRYYFPGVYLHYLSRATRSFSPAVIVIAGKSDKNQR